MNLPDDHRDTNWRILLIGAFAFSVAFWRGISSICAAVKGFWVLCTSVVARLNAQDATLKEQSAAIVALKTKDQNQQNEIDDLKSQLKASKAANEAADAKNAQLTRDLELERARVLEKELLIAGLERARNAALQHSDALETQAVIEKQS